MLTAAEPRENNLKGFKDVLSESQFQNRVLYVPYSLDADKTHVPSSLNSGRVDGDAPHDVWQKNVPAPAVDMDVSTPLLGPYSRTIPRVPWWS